MLNKKGKRIHYLEVTTCEDNFCAVLAENIENVLNKLYKDTGSDWSIEDVKYAATTMGNDIIKSALVIFCEE